MQAASGFHWFRRSTRRFLDLDVVVEPALVGELPLLAERNGEVRRVPFDENDLHEVGGREKRDDSFILLARVAPSSSTRTSM